MTRLTVDPELLLVTLLDTALTGVAVKASPDVDAVTDLPLVVVSPVQGAMVSNGAPGLGWSWTISFTVLAQGHAAASNLADLVYQTVHGFHDNQSGAAGLGYVNHVDDESMFTRVATVIEANNLTQYTGSFELVLRPN